MNSLLSKKIVIVTGGAGGLGNAMARLLVAEGAQVVLADIDEEKASATAESIGPNAHAIRADLSNPADVSELFSLTTEMFGTVDVLVNNAGITRDATIRNMTLEQWDLVHSVHLRGAFIAIKEAAERMRIQRSGSIVNISSISGKVGNFGQANYSSAKAGLVALTKVAAKELASYGVRVNAIQPGLITTPMTEQLSQDVLDRKLAEIPMGRAGDPTEIANVVLFLASDMASYLTGAVLEVTGGRYM